MDASSVKPAHCGSLWQPTCTVPHTPIWRCELPAGHDGAWHKDSTTVAGTYMWPVDQEGA